MSWQRVKALVRRYWFLYSRSSFRILDLVFWPVMDLLVWGFVTMYMIKLNSAMPAIFTFFIGAAILWNVLYRAQQAVTVSFLEDVWTRNLLNIFVAPVRVREFIAATYLAGLAQALIVMIVMSTMAFFIYAFDLSSVGFALIPLFINLLVMGWAIGMITTALILRWGQQAEALAWAVPFLIQPISAVFYPVEVLPAWLQPIANGIPATHVFEGMRSILRGQPMDMGHLLAASGTNLIYLLIGGWFFHYMFDQAREKGLLTKLGT